MVVLRIFLMGLVALVPGRDDGRLTVVLKAMDGSNVADGHEHYSVLAFNRHQMTCVDCTGGASCDEPGECDQIEEIKTLLNVRMRSRAAEQVAGWLLGGEQLVLSQDGLKLGRLTGLPSCVGTTPTPKVPVDHAGRRHTRWVPCMKDVDPDYGTIDGRFLNPGSENGVNAVLQLTGVQGEVAVFGLADVEEDQGGQPARTVRSFKFHPRMKPQDAPQLEIALADIVVVELPLKGDSITLEARFADSGRFRKVTLAAPEEDGAGIEPRYIDVLLGNLTPLSFERPDCRVGGRHFVHYYSLSDRSPAPPMEMRRIPFCADGRVPSDRVEVPDLQIPGPVRVPSGYGGATRPDEQRRLLTQWEPFVSGANRPICTVVSFEAP